jgi:hypothetical protein
MPSRFTDEEIEAARLRAQDSIFENFQKHIHDEILRSFGTYAGPRPFSTGTRYGHGSRPFYDACPPEHPNFGCAPGAFFNGHTKVTWTADGPVAGEVVEQGMVEVMPGCGVFHKETPLTSLRGCRVITARFLRTSAWSEPAVEVRR